MHHKSSGKSFQNRYLDFINSLLPLLDKHKKAQRSRAYVDGAELHVFMSEKIDSAGG
jgi:hypothetical protein